MTGAQLLNATGLHRPEYYFHYDRLRDNHNRHALNLMKAGVVYSNFVTTVSPRHATEAKDQGQGFGLERLHIHHQKYGGVVNGIDYEVWNPELDRCIPFHYNIHTIDDKYHNKRALRGRLLIADNEKPIVAFVGRLDPQKGLELIRHAIFYVLQRGGQFVLLGSSPDPQINNYFWSLKRQLNEHPDCHIEIGFNEELAHLIYAGADMVIVPSRGFLNPITSKSQPLTNVMLNIEITPIAPIDSKFDAVLSTSSSSDQRLGSTFELPRLGN